MLVYNSAVFVVSPVIELNPMEPQICKIYLAFTNSFVISIFATGLCVLVGSMAAFALARIQYAPRFGNIMILPKRGAYWIRARAKAAIDPTRTHKPVANILITNELVNAR